MNNKKLLVISFSALILGGFLLGAHLFKKNQQAKVATKLGEVFIRDHSPTLGPTDAKVTLVEFLDPECESCRAFYPMVKGLMKEFDGQIRLVVRYAAFHGNSKYVIGMLEGARKQDKYWEALERLFQYQPEWGGHHQPRPELIPGILEDIGLDVAKLEADSKDPSVAKLIEQDEKDRVELNVRGTPTFFVNGKPMEEFGIEPLRAAIQAELQ